MAYFISDGFLMRIFKLQYISTCFENSFLLLTDDDDNATTLFFVISFLLPCSFNFEIVVNILYFFTFSRFFPNLPGPDSARPLFLESLATFQTEDVSFSILFLVMGQFFFRLIYLLHLSYIQCIFQFLDTLLYFHIFQFCIHVFNPRFRNTINFHILFF